MEGCFCPSGTTLFDPTYKTCVPHCGKSIDLYPPPTPQLASISCSRPTKTIFVYNFRLCWTGWESQTGKSRYLTHVYRASCYMVDALLFSHKPGETWTSDCRVCECDRGSMSAQCQPVPCPTPQRPTCNEFGQQLVNQSDGCCTKQSCGQ